MASNLLAYRASTQIACSFASLASGSTRESAVVVNDTSTQNNIDSLVSVTCTIASGTPSTTSPSINVYISASEDGTNWPIVQQSNGATYTTGAGDASAGALGSPTNLRLIGIIACMTTTSASERTFRSLPFSVAAACNNVMPRKWSVFIENQVGVAFSTSTTSTANYVSYTGTYVTSS